MIFHMYLEYPGMLFQDKIQQNIVLGRRGQPNSTLLWLKVSVFMDLDDVIIFLSEKMYDHPGSNRLLVLCDPGVWIPEHDPTIRQLI